MIKASLLIFSLLGLTASVLPAANVRWADGTIAEPPQGKLLSDNNGFYGETSLTGVVYRYLSKLTPDSGDGETDNSRQKGRRLLNGDLGNHYFYFTDLKTPRMFSPGTVEFDFKARCRFNEVDLHVAPGTYRVTITASTEPGEEFKTVTGQRTYTVSNPLSLVRIMFAAPVSARLLRIEIAAVAGKDVALSEVYAWGTVETAVTAKNTAYQVYDVQFPQSVPGITSTSVDDAVVNQWVRNMPRTSAVLAEVPAWDALSKSMRLPEAAVVAAPVKLTMVRNGTAAAAMVLVNTSSTETHSGRIEVSAFTDAKGRPVPEITAEPGALAAMPSRDFGVQLTSIITASNKPSGEVLRRYVTNAEQISDFPNIKLNNFGNIYLWLKLRTDGCAPGHYKATMRALPGVEKNIEVEVLDVTLDDKMPRFVRTWWRPFGQCPFQSLDWVKRDAEHRLEIGTTELPEQVLQGPESLGAIMRARQPNMIFGFFQGEYGGKLWLVAAANDQWGKNGLPPEDKQKIRAQCFGLANWAKQRGLDFNHWYVDMADEPNSKNYRLFGEVVRAMHETVPDAMISCNPCSWYPGGNEPDDMIYPLLSGWYNDHIAISMPAMGLINYKKCGRRLFEAPRKFNAFYDVAGGRAKSESFGNVNYPRKMVWEAIKHGYNGWGFYSYFSTNGDETWNDLAAETPTYCMVYPGPNGPVPTRMFEAAREGYEDYLLMAYLKKHDSLAHAKVLEAYASGTAYTELRAMIYRILANQHPSR